MKRLFILLGVLSVAIAATIVTRISEYPNTTTLASNDLFIVAVPGSTTNRNVKFYHLAYLIREGQTVTQATYITLNVLTQYVDFNYVTNNIFINGKGNSVILTNSLNFYWSTITYSSGSNLTAINLTNTFFKLTLTNDAFMPVPAGFPGTNLAQSIQIHVKQDGTGARTLMLTNSGWTVYGQSESTNAMPALTTNANAVTVLTFATSPHTGTRLYGVPTAFTP